MASYETVIGLEVHVQINTRSKLFCSCNAAYGASPNSQVCPICLGYPGVLPVLNKKAVRQLVKTALGVGAGIGTFSKFDRKNYFYPDLPKNYQISQYDIPLSTHGKVTIEVEGKKKDIGLTRIHLEEDAGKSMHSEEGEGVSWVDLNRAGVPLMEMVSQPDMRSPEEAFEYLRVLKQILLYLEVSDCNMEEGSLRCDANISLRPVGQTEFGTKVEIKNLNSFSHVRKALVYEQKRQGEELDNNGKIVQETRLWDDAKGKTLVMRSKESAHDYRYFPEPDLVPMKWDIAAIEEIRATLPEMPQQRRARFEGAYKLPAYDAGILTAQKELADYFERCAKLWTDAKAISNWIMSELMRNLNDSKKDISESPVSPEHLIDMLKLIEDGTISGKIAKDLFGRMFQTGRSPGDIVKAEGLLQITDESDIIGVVQGVIQGAEGVVKDYKSGKGAALGFLVGQVMKMTKGKANPKIVNKLLKEELEKG
jgi:aspartyl-tRNA(Asn)/glutamyl-tRNA(Gln) amidotransferase subunit B